MMLLHQRDDAAAEFISQLSVAPSEQSGILLVPRVIADVPAISIELRAAGQARPPFPRFRMDTDVADDEAGGQLDDGEPKEGVFAQWPPLAKGNLPPFGRGWARAPGGGLAST